MIEFVSIFRCVILRTVDGKFSITLNGFDVILDVYVDTDLYIDCIEYLIISEYNVLEEVNNEMESEKYDRSLI